MAIKVKTKNEIQKVDAQLQPSYNSANPLRIPAITGPKKHTPNIIIRAVKIMLMDIRMKLYPKQTSEELENYSHFAELATRRM